MMCSSNLMYESKQIVNPLCPEERITSIIKITQTLTSVCLCLASLLIDEEKYIELAAIAQFLNAFKNGTRLFDFENSRPFITELEFNNILWINTFNSFLDVLLCQYIKSIKFRTVFFSVMVTIIVGGLIHQGTYEFYGWFIGVLMSLILIFYRHEV